MIIPAKDEELRVGSTVEAARSLPGVDLVLVVDDGSTDRTGALAREAGARLVRHQHNRGKGAAMETGAEALSRIEVHQNRSGSPPRHLLFLDADLGRSAADAAPLIEPVVEERADMSIALFPATRARLGGHGFVVRLARGGVRRATGWEPEQPLNGQRCLTRAAFETARPLARGFGAETGLSIDVLRANLSLIEVEVPLEHRAIGTDLRAQAHRARQFTDVARALAVRGAGPVARRALSRTGLIRAGAPR
nr:glycosyltransferase family 2 protein [Nocardiopsis kunsanensis]